MYGALDFTVILKLAAYFIKWFDNSFNIVYVNSDI